MMDAQQPLSKSDKILILTMFQKFTVGLTGFVDTCAYEYESLEQYLATDPTLYDFEMWCQTKHDEWMAVAKELKAQEKELGEDSVQSRYSRGLAKAFEKLVVVAERETL